MAYLQHLAHAKINLTLHITGKRQDGYHLLESLMSFAALHDRITIHAAETLSLSVEGPFAGILHADNAENILLKTAKLLAAKAGIAPLVHITLHKSIPVGAGIGGGSADAAALMHLLYRLWELQFSAQEMQELALQIGADVPVCYSSTTTLVAGIGEQLQPIPFPLQMPAVLVNPLVPLSTIAVFKQGVSHYSAPGLQQDIPLEASSFLAWLKTKTNDLEVPAIQLMPVIADMLLALTQQDSCLLSRMSGSGATCFGLFQEKEDAAKAAAQIKARYPQWWVEETVIGNF